MNRRILFLLLLVAAALLAFTSCPNPITDQTFRQMSDKNPPNVDIFSPTDNSSYTQTVTVQGTALDQEGRLKDIAWTITGTLGLLQQGTIAAADIGSTGSFSFQFSTLTFSGPIAVTVTVTDWNDNVSQAQVTLSSPGSQLSSFTATADNKKVTLNWDPIPGATYTVYYTTNGSLPSESYGSQLAVAAPPQDVEGLVNGAMHVFLLKASAGGQDYWSGYVRAIPLSPFTLAPMVRGGYHEVSIEWRAIAGTAEFEVLRATSPAGPWTNLTGIINATSFVDASVSDGTWYYYAVRPALAGSRASTYNAAEPLQLPPTPAAAITGKSLPSPANRVKVFGNYAFVADEQSGLVVLDVQDPRHPAQVAAVDTTEAKDIVLNAAGTRAYLADGYGGLRIVDISAPANPVLLGSLTIGSTYDTYAVTVIEPGTSVFAYVLARDPISNTRLYGVNVTNPASPTQFLYYYDGGATYEFTDLAATWYAGASRFIYLASGNTPNGELVKIQDNTINAFNVLGAYNDPAPLSSAYKSNHVYVKPVSNSTDRVYVLGMVKAYLEPPPPYVLRTFGQTTVIPGVIGTSSVLNGYIQDLVLRGTKIYAADGIGLQVFDVSNPAAPVVGAFWNTPGTASGVDADAAGATAFVASFTLGLHTVDLALPLTLSTRGKYSSTATYTSEVAVRDGMAAAAIGHSGQQRLQLINITNPASPQALGAVSLVWPESVALSGDYAFVVDSSGLRILNVANTLAPYLVATASPIASMDRVRVWGDYAFITGGGLQIYDISDPTKPVAVGFYDSDSGTIGDVALRDAYAYITDGAYFQPNSLKVLNVADPANPVFVGKGATSAMIIDSVALSGDYALVTDSMPDQGLWAVNINAQSPSFLSTYGPCDTALGGTSGTSGGVATHGGWTFVADSTAGLAVIDVSAPTGLDDADLRVNHATQIVSAQRVVVSGKYAYVADFDGTSGGLTIVEIAP